MVGGGARAIGMDLEEDAGAFAGGIGDRGEAFLDQGPARCPGFQFARRLRQRPHRVFSHRAADMPDAGPAINSRGGRTQAGGKPGAPGVRPQTARRIDSTKPIGWDGIKFNSTDLVLSFPPAGPTTTHETGAMLQGRSARRSATPELDRGTSEHC